ncbi:hypothetical protein GGR26_002300 [Lewinella marina]|nr:T9SS type A sorting domain-containing protein [Neolewinella marina]NJB86532.1 hypothetical protein [Neolewinella marina]
MACATPAYAQGNCGFRTDASSDLFCSTCNNNGQPVHDIINANRELEGVLKVDNDNNSGIAVEVPLGCGEDSPLNIGAFTINIGEGDSVIFDSSIGVSSAAVDFDVFIKPSATNAVIFFQGTEYQSNSTGPIPSFDDLETFIEAQAQALPVDMYYWKAEATPKGVKLKWATRSEIDNDFYSIEYSTDGRNFTEIARVDGKGSSDGVVRYEHLDVPSTGGTHYYRLIQQDFDGTRETFEVRSVTYGSEAAALKSLYPNPARAGQRVSFQAPAHVTEVVLHSITGREIQRSPATNGGIDLPANLPGGIYVLRAGGESTRLLVR